MYLDPPYNNRQYSANYHPLNYIAKYDASIIPYGKTGLLKNSNKSNYSISKNVENSFNSLIENINTKFILLSYNNEGLLSFNKIQIVWIALPPNIILPLSCILYSIKFKSSDTNFGQRYFLQYSKSSGSRGNGKKRPFSII